MIYLDNAATTFPKPEIVYKDMEMVNRTIAVNSGRGSYKAARKANEIIDETKQMLLKLFHAEGIAEICFTPSVTHAINQILYGLNFSKDSVVYITPYEHNAVARTINLLQKKIGFDVEFIPLDEDLRVDLQKTEFQFSLKKPTHIIANKVSNVTGYVLPVEQVFHQAKKYEAITIMDGAQAAGLCKLDMRTNDSDIICFAGHKTLYGPFGIGGFALKKGVVLETVLSGGTGTDSLNLEMPDNPPDKFEASSPNIVAIAGLHASLSILDQQDHMEHSVDKTKYLIQKMKELDNIKLVGVYEPGETLGIVSFLVEDYLSDDVGTILDDEFDIAVRTGYHCAPYIHDYLGDKDHSGTVRVGIGLFTTNDEIDCLIEALQTL